MLTNHIRNIFGEIQHEIARGVERLETLRHNNNILGVLELLFINYYYICLPLTVLQQFCYYYFKQLILTSKIFQPLIDFM